MTSAEDFGGWAALNFFYYFFLFFFYFFFAFFLQGKNIFPPKGEILSEILSGNDVYKRRELWKSLDHNFPLQVRSYHGAVRF